MVYVTANLNFSLDLDVYGVVGVIEVSHGPRRVHKHSSWLQDTVNLTSRRECYRMRLQRITSVYLKDSFKCMGMQWVASVVYSIKILGLSLLYKKAFSFVLCTRMNVATVEPPNKGHFGANSFVPCREVVPISEVK